MRHRHFRSAATLVALLASGLLLSGPTLAYWELVPRVEGGITTETNPYNRVESQSYDSATGAFADFRLDSAYRTPRSTVTLIPRFRTYQYSGSDDRLDDDDYSLDLNASHQWDTASASVRAGYRDNGIRTSEFNTAIPGQTTDDSQETWSFGPSLTYTLSPLNTLQFTADLTDITYDASPTAGYFDYTNSSVQATWIHAFNQKTSALFSVNGGKFKATNPYGPAENNFQPSENNTDSLGGTIAVEHKLSPTVTATVTAGSSHSTQDIKGIYYDPTNPAFLCPTLPTLCSISESSNNFVGGITLRQVSEVMTTTIDYSQSQAPRSNGSSVVSESFRLNFDRDISQRFEGSVNLLYVSDSALGNYGRQDRVYYSASGNLRYRLTETLSLYGTYTYTINDDDANSDKQKNNRLFFSLVYRGVGIRR
jgi:hypothetical protein